MATKYDFAIGDVVFIKKNNSPNMTINKLYRDTAEVVWFDQNDQLHNAYFSYDVLQKKA